MERQLVIRAQRGDEEAFADLVALVGGRLHAIARRILRDLDLADDATQRALPAIWRDLPQMRDPATFEGWAYKALVRVCFEPGLLVVAFASTPDASTTTLEAADAAGLSLWVGIVP